MTVEINLILRVNYILFLQCRYKYVPSIKSLSLEIYVLNKSQNEYEIQSVFRA